MFCAPCRKHNVDLGENIHNFCSGTDDFKLEFINTHQSSEAHAWATCMEAASTASPDKASAEQMLKTMNSIALGRVDNIFRTYHVIAQYGHPFADLDCMCKPAGKKGVDINSVFRNDKSARAFMRFIAEAEGRALKEKPDNCEFFLVISDRVMDSIIEVVAVVCILCGKIHCQVAGAQPVKKMDASAIKNAIEDTVQRSFQLSLASHNCSRKLVGFGSTRTDVMVAENNKEPKLRETQPWLHCVNCFADRLKMAYKGAVKDTHLCNVFGDALRNTYHFYHNSSLNKNNLKATYKAIKLCSAIPSFIGGSQWFPRLQRVLWILLKVYPAFILYLSKVNHLKITGNASKN